MPEDDLDFFNRDRLISGRRPRSRPHDLLFLVESWSRAAGSDDLLGFLAATEVFGALDQAALRSLLPHLEPVHAAAGEWVLEAGQRNDSLYLVAYGRLEVGAGKSSTREAGPGQVVGVGALLLGDPPDAWARAIRDSVLLRLSARSFNQFAERHTGALLGLCRELMRISTVDRIPPASVHTVAIVNAGSRPIPPGFVPELARASNRLGTTLILTAESLDRELGPDSSKIALDDPRNGSLVAWLHRAEQQHRLVLYQTDVTPTTWTRRCLRQADRVLLVADASADPRLSEIESELLTNRVRCELTLLHSAESAGPTGTDRWLKPRKVTHHHHLRNRSGDYERLVRHLSGRAHGLVLGGGGSRGFAHLGVMQALEEANIPIDTVGGTSIGAVMGALLAAGLDHSGRVRSAVAGMVKGGNLARVTLPLVSFSSGRKVSHVLRHEPAFAGAIEDLWSPFFCVSASLDQALEVIHERGPTWRSLRSSLSLPGVWPPVFEDGKMLVDGGVLNNLPIDVMASRVGSGPIIAVDLQPERQRASLEPFDATLSGWRVLANRITPFRGLSAAPGILDTIMRSMSLAGTASQRNRLDRQSIALYLRPPVADAGLLDFRSGPRLIEPAYRYTLEELERTGLPLQT